MVSVSLCMIVKNEKDVLERCLESVSSLVDEITIADTGSTDRFHEVKRDGAIIMLPPAVFRWRFNSLFSGAIRPARLPILERTAFSYLLGS